MPRTVRSTRLESATQRAKLALGRFYWSGVAEGLALGYRRTSAGYGTWYVRTLADREAGRYDLRRIARADDHEPADGAAVLTYLQANQRALQQAADTPGSSQSESRARLKVSAPYTVKRAVDDYLDWFAAHRKSLAATRATIKAHILPKFGERLLGDLDHDELARWHRRLAATKARVRTGMGERKRRYRDDDMDEPEIARRRKASANRILATFRAVLNHAWREGRVPSDAAWRRLRPFRGADAPRISYLEEDAARRLVNACPPALRSLVRAGLLTGCRYGELVALRCEDYRADAGTIYVATSKSGKPRHVPLSAEGVALFEELTAGHPAGETLFLRDGIAWGKNAQVRELAAACARAGVDPPVSFHILRHSFGSWLARRGVALQVIAEALGHSDTRITMKHYAHLAPSHVAQIIRENLPEIAPAPGKVKALKPGKARQAAPAGGSKPARRRLTTTT